MTRRYSPRSGEQRTRTVRLHPIVDEAIEAVAATSGKAVNAVVNEALYAWALNQHQSAREARAALRLSGLDPTDDRMQFLGAPSAPDDAWLERALSDAPDDWAPIARQHLAHNPTNSTSYDAALRRLAGED